MWDKVLKFLGDNKDVLELLFGSGFILVVLGGLFTFGRWLIKEYRLRRIRTNDNFPFKVIPPNSNAAKEILGGADDDPLADRNVPYQQRIQGRNTRRELEELIEDNRWILITGRTGLGKTREAVQVAQSLNNEGWTVLYLTHETWLDAPAKLPNNVPERKLLFFLDDLNKKCLSSKAEVRPDANESITLPIYEPFQPRLQRTLDAFDTFCGKSEIKVIATARDEKTSELDELSEWDKLGWQKYNKDLWEKFKLVNLPEPDKITEQKFLVETAKNANINVNSNELPTLARRNDGTFRNLIENLSSAKSEKVTLSLENFRETLKGTWQKRYQRVIRRYPDARYIYDSIELIRKIGIPLIPSTIINIAELISSKTFLRRIVYRRKFFLILKYLIRTENILNPKDDQIEAKGYQVNLEDYLSNLYYEIGKGYYANYNHLFQIGYFYSFLLFLPKSFFIKKQLSLAQKIYGSLVQAGSALNNTGNAYRYYGFYEQALVLYKNSLELKKWDISTLMFRRFRTSSWIGLGRSYYGLKQYEESISAFKKVIKLDSKNEIAWYYLGNIYYNYKLYEDSIQAFQNAVRLNPKNVGAWNKLGIIFSIRKDNERALSAYQQAAELVPNDGSYQSSMIGILKKLGRDEEAKEQEVHVRILMEKDKEYNRACFEAICGNIDESLTLLRLALEEKQQNREWAQQDPDFDFIRENPRFKELVGLN